MTKDEAITILKNTAWLGWAERAEKVSEAVRMAVEALKRETSDNLISRQAAIDALAKFVPYAICDEPTESYTNGLTDAYNLILQLPSTQPEDCDTCKHGYFGDEQCNSCRVRFTSHYERRTDGEIIPE